MSVTVKNTTDYPVKGSFPGLYSYEIPAKGEFAFTDHVVKVKVPTPNGVIEQEVVTSAKSLATSAIKDFGKAGLELVEAEEVTSISLESEEVTSISLESEEA